MKLISVVAAGISLVSCLAYAQESRGTILGRVVDPSGAVVVGAKVAATNLNTNTVAASVSNHEGNYEIPYLLSGMYRVTADLPGFKKAVRDQIEVRLGDRLTLDLALTVGAATESVVVTGETPLLETASASMSMVVDSQRLASLPVVGGGVSMLSRLTPGLASTSGGHDAGNPFDQTNSTGRVAVAGTRGGSSEVLMDGAPNMVQRSESFSPPQDLVQEFKIQTAPFDAGLGHAAGGIVNVSLKSGTNALHGTSYYHDSRIRSIPWFSSKWLWDPKTGPVTQDKRDQANPGWLHQRWGDTFTGPVVLPKIYDGHNRTFFTFGYEGLYVRRMTTFTGTAPTADERKGDMSALLKLGSQYQIYDPATVAAASGGRFSRQPLPGNIVPASRINPIAQKMLAFWADPNQSGTTDGRQNYFRIAPENRDWRSFISRVDHSFSDKNRMYARVNQYEYGTKSQSMPTVAFGSDTTRTAYGAVIDDVHVFNPQLLLNIRYGLTFEMPRTARLSQGFDLVSLGFPQSLVNEIRTKLSPAGITFPETVIDGGAFTNLGAGGGDSSSIYYQTLSGTFTKIAGNHSLRFGGEFRLMRENGYTFGNVSPHLEFASAWTKGPLDTAAAAPIGQGFASFLLGLPTAGTINNNASRAEQSKYSAAFIQDDWRITPKLTVNLGLRYEYESPTTERFNRSIRGFDYQTVNPVDAAARANYANSPIAQVPVASFRSVGGLLFAGVGQPRSLWMPDRNNFAPRVAFAYQVNPKTVIRAGYGIFYDVTGIDSQNVNQGGFNQPTNAAPSLDNGITFRSTLSNPFPDGIQVPTGATGGLRTFLGRGVTYFYENLRNAYMQRWSVSVQRELPGRVLLQTAYIGNRGNRLDVSREHDAIPAQYLSRSPERDQGTIDFLSAQVSSPYYGLTDFVGTGLGNLRVNRSQLLRPYPQFTSVSSSEPIGYSYYHSLIVQSEKRFSKGFTFQAGWTWSKFMEAASFLNDSDLTLEKVISDQDYPNRLSVSGIYELPFGSGRRFLTSAKGIFGGVVSGWQVQGTFEGQSGKALGFGNAIFRGNLHDIPLSVDQRSVERWFNTDAGFERSSAKALGSNIRTFSSRFTGIRADGINNFDLSMFKTVRINERFRAQLRLESFNTMNHPQFGAPNTTPTSTAFGTITAEAGHGQRELTLAVKLLF